MTIYIFAPIVVWALGVLFDKRKIIINGRLMNRLIVVFFAFLIPIYIYGFRSVEIGIDTWSYAKDFQNIANSNISAIIQNTNVYEIGFTLLCYGISLIGHDSHIFLLVTSLVINCLYMRALLKCNNNIIIGILSYLYLGNFLYNLNIMRQAIAVAILLNALLELENGKLRKYIILVFLATTVHTFSIVFLLFPIPMRMIKTKDSLKRFLMVLFVGILLSLGILRIFTNQFFTRYSYYFERNWNNSQRIGVTSLAYIFLEIAITVILVKSFERNSEKGKIILYSTIMICACATLMMMPIFGIYERISKYFSAILVFSAPYAIDVIKKKYNRYVAESIFLVASSVYYLYIIGIDAYNIVPFLIWPS